MISYSYLYLMSSFINRHVSIPLNKMMLQKKKNIDILLRLLAPYYYPLRFLVHFWEEALLTVVYVIN